MGHIIDNIPGNDKADLMFSGYLVLELLHDEAEVCSMVSPSTGKPKKVYGNGARFPLAAFQAKIATGVTRFSITAFVRAEKGRKLREDSREGAGSR
jgi:hypothetical protein